MDETSEYLQFGKGSRWWMFHIQLHSINNIMETSLVWLARPPFNRPSASWVLAGMVKGQTITLVLDFGPSMNYT